jgi:VanZ family protein
LFTSLYGASDELHQYFVPNRSCDFYDWLADSIGAVMALITIYLLTKFYKPFNRFILRTNDTSK